MSLKHGLLGLLGYGSMTGYELDKVFKDSLSFFWQAKTSQIYRELDAMERQGWLASERVIQSDKPNKRVYSLTGSGKQEFLHWMAEPDSDINGAAYSKSAFLMRVFFAGELSAGQSLAMLRAYRDKCLASGLAMGEANNAAVKYGTVVGDETKARYWKITAIYGEMFYRMGIEWAEKAIAILEEEKQ